MKKVLSIHSVHQYNVIVGVETLHPLISVIDFSKTNPVQNPATDALNFGVYAVFLKQSKHCTIRYGRNYYDYQEGTLVFIAPGQVISIEENGDDYQPEGYVLLFHPDLILGTSLGRTIKQYAFFSYDVHEALHISEKERQIVLECFSKVNHELNQSIDKHSKSLMAANIELFLHYCLRFYDRQFIIRDHVHKGIVEKFENLLNDYFQTDKPQTIGQPTVSYCATQLHFSANYFGDLIRKETGRSAQEYIQSKLIEVAKERIFDSSKSISEVAYELGFQYPQHFSRLFKQLVGQSPTRYRILN